MNFIKGLIRSSIPTVFPSNDTWTQRSFSQCGEDLIVAHVFSSINCSLPSYLDIGAHHPYKLNNTAYFYNKGCRGINIEPDSALFNEIQNARPKDINLNIGVRKFSGVANFYMLSASTMNTFCKDAAEQLAKEYGFQIKEVKPMRVDTLSNIVNCYSGGIFPDFLSLDVEGLDTEILE